MTNIARVALVALLLVGAGGCARVTAWLVKANSAINTYAPIVGKDLLMIANILVQAECSPIAAPAAGTVTNVLNIVAPNSASAAKVSSVLETNAAIAAQLCPFYAAIKTAVGQVPNGAPTQIIAVPTTPAA